MPSRKSMIIASLVAVVGCESAEATLGLDEPIRVQDAWFLPEDLPEADDVGVVTSIDVANSILIRGQRGRILTGRVAENAYALGLRLEGQGSGWWVLPVQDLNPMYPGERDFRVVYDVADRVALGSTALSLAAVGEGGERGPVYRLAVCTNDALVPRGLNACDPTLPPPAAVISLEWDHNVDLDLVVRTPEGTDVSWKQPITAPPGTEGVSIGRMTRDSNASCVVDGRNGEALAWSDPPVPGEYRIYADLFDSCGAPSVSFVARVYVREARADGTYDLIERERHAGALLNLQASGGARTPIYVATIRLP